ncbi:MAG TPA: YihY family inner membrane protein [Rhodanobacteraceae bacterium]
MAFHFDRDRARAFGLFVWRRFVDDKCFETAGALSYTTLFALVPLTAAVFGILTALPAFDGLNERLQHFVFSNFVPAAGRAVQHYLLEFAGNASRLTTLGVIVFLLSALAMMANIEERFNRIWRVTVRRSPVSRFLMYWAALTLGPLLVVAGLTVTSYVMALPLLGQVGAHVGLVGALPFVVTWVGLFALYMLVPNRHVRWRDAVLGSLLSALLFAFAKWAFTAYVRSVPSYQQIYGQLAVIPIFLVWVYLSWAIVLLGASITASLNSFEYRPRECRLPAGAEFVGLLQLVKHFVRLQRQGRGMDEEAMLHCERFMTDDLLARYLLDLQKHQLVRRGEDDQWVMVRHPDNVTLAQLYADGHYRLPVDQALVERAGQGLPAAVVKALQALAVDLRKGLEQPLGALFPADDEDEKAAATASAQGPGA